MRLEEHVLLRVDVRGVGQQLVLDDSNRLLFIRLGVRDDTSVNGAVVRDSDERVDVPHMFFSCTVVRIGGLAAPGNA